MTFITRTDNNEIIYMSEDGTQYIRGMDEYDVPLTWIGCNEPRLQGPLDTHGVLDSGDPIRFWHLRRLPAPLSFYVL